MISFFQYYGIDWLAMALSLAAVYLLGNRSRYGFVTFAVANVLWICLGVTLMHSLGIAVGNAVFLVMNVRGFWTWSRKTVLA